MKKDLIDKFNDKVAKFLNSLSVDKSVCKFYLDPIRRNNVALLHGFYDDVN